MKSKTNSTIQSIFVYLTTIVFLFTQSISIAYSTVRPKSQPDVNQFSPAPLPQIPLGEFFHVDIASQVDPETAHLKVQQSDFQLPSRDGINLPLVRYYDSGRQASGISGQGWRWSFESKIEQLDDNTLRLIGFDGEPLLFKSVGNFQYVAFEQGKMQIDQITDGYSLTIGKSIINYDANGRVVNLTGSNGGQINYLYKNNQLVKVDLFERAELTFSYNPQGLLSEMVLPTGQSLEYQYTDGQLSNVSSAGISYVDYAYSEKLLSKLSYGEEYSSYYQYSEIEPGQIIKATLFDGNSVDYDFKKIIDEQGKQQTRLKVSYFDRSETIDISEGKQSVTRSDDSKVEVLFDDRFSTLPSKQILADGSSVKFSYDGDGRLIELRESSGRYTNYQYQNDQLLSVQSSRGTKVTLQYDDKGNLKTLEDENGAKTKFSYTILGQVAKITGPMGEVNKYKYYKDSGMLSEIIDTQGSRREFTYDGLYRLKSEWLDDIRILSYRYNDAARELKIVRTDREAEIWTKIAYNTFGRPTRISSSNGRDTDYQYNLSSQLTGVQEPGNNAAQLQYDEYGNLSELRTANGDINRYEYNQLNQLTKLINPFGETLSYQYDLRGRIVSEQVSDQPSPIRYAYDALGQLSKIEHNSKDLSEFEYNQDGELIRAQRNGTETILARDAANNPLIVNLERKHTTDGAELVNQYRLKWHKDGSIRSLLYPSGMQVAYQYDKSGRVTELTINGAESEEKKVEIQYQDDRFLISYPNGIQSKQIGFNDGEQDYLQVIDISKNEEQLARFEYDYDNDGNLIASGTQQGDKELEPRMQAYAYDDRNQLIGFSDSLANGGKAYEYDADYNRTKVTTLDANIEEADKQKTVAEYQYDKGRLINDGTYAYSYDAHGNITQKTAIDGEQTVEYRYTAQNQLKTIITELGGDKSTLEYQYDALGNRFAKTIDGKTSYSDYLLGHRLVETDGENSQEYVYIPGYDQIIAQRDISQQKSNTYYYHRDRNNSVVLLTDENGKAVNRYSYDPFGETIYAKEEVSNKFAYTGRYLEPESELYDYRTRFYQPEIGRFTTEDRYLAYAGVPASYNRYTYVFNNPTRYRDPNGEFVNVVAAGVGAVVGGAVGWGIQVGSNVANGATSWEGVFDGGLKAAGKGAVVGGVGGLTGGATLWASAIYTGAAGTAADIGYDVLFDDKDIMDINAGDVAGDFIVNVVFGLGMGKIFEKLKTNLPGRQPVWLQGGFLDDVSVKDQWKSFSTGISNLFKEKGGKNTGRAIWNIFKSDATGGITGGLQDKANKFLKELLGIGEDKNSDDADSDSKDGDGADKDGADKDEADKDDADKDEADKDEADKDDADKDEADKDEADKDDADKDEADKDEADSEDKEEDEADKDEANSEDKEEDEADKDEANSEDKEEDEADKDEKDTDDNNGLDCIQAKGVCIDRPAEDDPADKDKADKDAKENKDRTKNCRETNTCAEVPPFIWKPG